MSEQNEQMVICVRCDGSGYMDIECCNGSSGCSCGGNPVSLPCTYCGGTGLVRDIAEAEIVGHARFMKLYGNKCFLGSGPK